jgi:hypothetical protein
VARQDKVLAWLHGEVRTPPFSKAARIEAGYLLRELQRGRLSRCPSPGQCQLWVRAVTS